MSDRKVGDKMPIFTQRRSASNLVHTTWLRAAALSLALMFHTSYSICAPLTAFGTAARYEAVSDLRAVDKVSKSVACGKCEILESKAAEFGNGNTFVKYESNVSDKSVIVRVPEVLTPDMLMEALMRIRTLETLGASRIAIEVIGHVEKLRLMSSKGRQLGMSIPLFFSVAGAAAVIDSAGVEYDISLLGIDRAKELIATKAPSQGEIVVAAGSHPDLAIALSRELQRPIATAETDVRGKQVFLLAAPLTPVNESLFESMAELSTMTEQGASVQLVSPYLPYARSDKIDQEGIAVGGSLVADLIKAAGARSITYARAHAPQSAGFYSIPTNEASSYETIVNGIKSTDFDVFIAPDSGAVKDVTKAVTYAISIGALPKQARGSTEMALPIASVNKERIGSTIRTHGMKLPAGLSSLKGLRVLIIDDEAESGSSIADAAAEARRLGASFVGAAVTAVTGNAKKVLDSPDIDMFWTTDSIPVQIKHPKLKVLSLASEITSRVKLRLSNRQNSCSRSLL